MTRLDAVTRLEAGELLLRTLLDWQVEPETLVESDEDALDRARELELLLPKLRQHDVRAYALAATFYVLAERHGQTLEPEIAEALERLLA